MTLKRLSILLLLTRTFASAQSDPEQLARTLQDRIQTPGEVEFQLREYLMERVAKLSKPATAEQWTAESERLRKHLLEDVVFHGWPKEWVNAPPKFTDLGTIQSGKGYRIRKLRYEIVPGFQSTAILYEPEQLQGKVPAILNVTGHEYAMGKAAEYEQKRCINFAKRGILALSLEWLACGEMRQGQPGMEGDQAHWVAADLDLVGANAVGLFYLAMRRGLDYLYEHPNADRARLGMTGLSGGGWQTITLSSLDKRVSVAVSVAGFASLISELDRAVYGDDIEQIPADFFAGADYPHLTAMRAPRPTLITYDAEDDCCFRAAIVKPYVFDQVVPFFALFGEPDNLQWHENRDPGTHNYQLDNRLQAYRFFAQHFGLPAVSDEIPVAAEIKSYEELAVGLPKDNLTILGLAKQLAAGIERPPIPSTANAKSEWVRSEREKLRKLVRYQPTSLKHPWAVANSKDQGVETRSYRFELSNGLSATGVWVKAITAPDNAPATVVLKDEGKESAAAEVSERVNRGEQVLALDVLFTGDASPEGPQAKDKPQYLAQLMTTMGERPLGVEVSQLIAITQWLQRTGHPGKIRLESTGMRNQVRALIASALEPTLYSEVVVHQGIRSLSYLLDAPVLFDRAPDLFCLDLYKEFDVARLAALSEPTKLAQEKYLEVSK
jgi:dienelactone hydrolase